MTATLLLHEQFGFNATQPICFYCHRPQQRFAFLGGYVPNKTPAKSHLNYELCGVCRAEHGEDIVLVEVQDGPVAQNQLGIEVNGVAAYPSGRWMVLEHNEQAVRRLFTQGNATNLLRDRFSFITETLYTKLLELYHDESREREGVSVSAGGDP